MTMRVIEQKFWCRSAWFLSVSQITDWYNYLLRHLGCKQLKGVWLNGMKIPAMVFDTNLIDHIFLTNFVSFNRDIIRWSFGEGCREGEFIMTEPEGVARLWGQQKGKATMNYEKLSRALRYYKGGNVLVKFTSKCLYSSNSFSFQFVKIENSTVF